MSGVTVDYAQQVWIGLRKDANKQFEWTDGSKVRLLKMFTNIKHHRHKTQTLQYGCSNI